jgi:hypothetical protein
VGKQAFLLYYYFYFLFVAAFFAYEKRSIPFLISSSYRFSEGTSLSYFFSSSISFAGIVANRLMTSMFFSLLILSSVLLISARILK